MPAKNSDLHGMVPDTSTVALLLIDFINALDFEGSELLLPHALNAARCTAELKKRARAAEIPVIYVNDNFGRWQSDFHKHIEHCLEEEMPGKPFVELLKPTDDDYFVLKPKHSAFYSTSLDILLDYLGARTLVITGLAGNICVLFTANDAYMRDFHVVVPCDCTASNTVEDNGHALRLMEQVLKADTTPSTKLDLAGLLRLPREIARQS